MKILYLTQFFDATRGGGEVVFHYIAKKLAAKGHKVYVIRHKTRGENCSIRLSNMKVYDINPSLEYKGGLPSTLNQNLLYIYNAVRLGLKVIKKEKIDVIHANTYTPVFVGVILSRLTGRPIIITIHDVAFTNGLIFWKQWMKQFNTSFPSLLSLVSYIGELLTFKLPVNVIHTVSETSREDILKIQNKKPVVVIPNGLDLTMYSFNDADTRYDDYIVYIGRCVYYKNLEVIIKAMKIVLEKNPKSKLIVIGDGPMRHSWEKLANDYGVMSNIIFKGYLSHEEKIDILKGATALVLPSVWEGFGMVVLEAWALKKPVLVAKVKPLSDIVTHGKDGFHANPFEPAKWAEYLEALLRDKNLARQMGEAGYVKLVNNFSVHNAINKLEDLYIRLTRARPGQCGLI